MDLIYIAILALGAFVAVWMFFVVPAERRHHERKLAALRKQIEKREAANQEIQKEAARDADDELATGNTGQGKKQCRSS